MHFTNAYVDIILCDCNMVGQTSPHWLQPPRHCIHFDFKQYMCVCWFPFWCCMCEMCRLPSSDTAAANLRLGSCQTLADSGSAAAKLRFGSCHTLIYSGLVAAKLRQVPDQRLGNEKLSWLMLLCQYTCYISLCVVLILSCFVLFYPVQRFWFVLFCSHTNYTPLSCQATLSIIRQK